MAGLFHTLNTGVSGVNVSQSSINATSQNISNSNTVGYSRQRAKIIAAPALSSGIKGTGQIGAGAQVNAIERVRDTFLDYQVRKANATYGSANIESGILSQVEDIFNEPSETGISKLIGSFFDSWQEVAKQPNSSNTRTVLLQNTLALTDTINSIYSKLEDLQTNCQSALKQNVVYANTLIEKIDDVNKQIKSITATGQTPNDLMDTRDNYMDELSSIMGIKVDAKNYNSIVLSATDSGRMSDATLVASTSSGSSSRLSYVSSIEQDPNNSDVHVITYYKLGDSTNDSEKQTVKVSGLTAEEAKKIENSRILWADESGQLVKADGTPIDNGKLISASELMVYESTTGETSGYVDAQNSIEEYKNQLNSLAKAIAYSINTVHSGLPSANNPGGYPEYDALPFFVNSDSVKYNSSGEVANIQQVLSTENEISAKNITVNKELINDVMKLKVKTHDCNYYAGSDNNVDGEGDGSRASAIASLRDSLIRIQDFGGVIKSRGDLFDSSKGNATLSNFGMTISKDTSGMTFDSFFQDTVDKLGVKASAANSEVENQTNILGNLENSRDSISGVSLDEEMANLIQFQHAYSANAKVISTINSLLDVVINGLI